MYVPLPVLDGGRKAASDVRIHRLGKVILQGPGKIDKFLS